MSIDPHNLANRNPHRNTVLAQLRDMQEVAFRDIRSDDTKPNDRAALMRAYVLLEEQRRILRMRPAPKPIDVSELQKHRAKRKSRAQLGSGTPAVVYEAPRPQPAQPAPAPAQPTQEPSAPK